MGSIVEELQREAMSSTSNISDMLRKSLVVAKKLKIKDFENWVNQELNGYKVTNNALPEYREIIGNLQWFNPVRGWCPAIIPDEEILDMVRKIKTSQPITELEDLVNSDHEYLAVQLPQGQQNLLAQLFNEPTQFQLSFGKSQAQRMIDTVRNIVLEWALKLEEDGIMGEGLSFSKEEKQEASKHDYTVVIGNASGVQIQQQTQHSTQTMINEMDLGKVSTFISTLKENLNQIGLQEEAQKVVEYEVTTISKELESDKPKSSKIKQSLQSIRTSLEGAAGNLTASGLLYLLGQLGS
jgi:hypothetical protein